MRAPMKSNKKLGTLQEIPLAESNMARAQAVDFLNERASSRGSGRLPSSSSSSLSSSRPPFRPGSGGTSRPAPPLPAPRGRTSSSAARHDPDWETEEEVEVEVRE